MAKDYNAIHYIQNQVKNYNADDKLSDLLIRGFNLIYNNEESDGCASNSVALYVCLKNMGFNPQIYYGLCGIKNEFEFYHMWIELMKKLLTLQFMEMQNLISLVTNWPILLKHLLY